MGIYKIRVANGKCGRCGKNAIEHPVKVCDPCRDKAKAFQKAIRERRRQNCCCLVCGKKLNIETRYMQCDDCREVMNKHSKSTSKEKKLATAKKSRKLLRQQILDAYGRKCACCGETEEVFLTLDHIDDSGSPHRKVVGSCFGVYQHLRREGYPSGFQILCWNCNWAKSHGGCPHQHQEGVMPYFVVQCYDDGSEPVLYEIVPIKEDDDSLLFKDRWGCKFKVHKSKMKKYIEDWSRVYVYTDKAEAEAKYQELTKKKKKA